MKCEPIGINMFSDLNMEKCNKGNLFYTSLGFENEYIFIIFLNGLYTYLERTAPLA